MYSLVGSLMSQSQGKSPLVNKKDKCFKQVVTCIHESLFNMVIIVWFLQNLHISK